jgi:phosphoglycerate dehydrogenase-like enzyme
VFGAPISEYVFGYLLAHERRIFERRHNQQAHRWERTPGGRLRGKTIGILGVGSIGAEIARTAKHFGMTVRGYARQRLFRRCGCLLSRRDSIGIHARTGLPGQRAAEHAAASHHRRLRVELCPGAVLVNVGRGAAVDEGALAGALKAGRLALAVLDVFEQEPLPEDHPFWDTPNLLMTFHTSAWHDPADLIKPFVDNYMRFVRGEPLEHRVDFERGY